MASESEKSISDLTKETLTPFLKSYTQLLLEGLKEDGIIIENSNSKEKTFQLAQEARNESKANGSIRNETNEVLNNYFEFREILRHVYSTLGYGDVEKASLTNLIEDFEKRGVFRMPGHNIVRLKDIFNKGKYLLEDQEIEQDAIKIFRENKIHFSTYTVQLLEFYTKEKVKEHFPNFTFDKNSVSFDSNAITELGDFIGVNMDKSAYDLVFEIKYRKKASRTLKESLFQAYEYLMKYNAHTGKDNYLLIILYTPESTSILEKLDYRFKQYMQELFPSYLGRIFFIPLFTGNVHLISDEFKSVINKLSRITTKRREFRFFNQPINKLNPEIDDHYYDKLLNLGNFNYLITIKPISSSPHWRCGLKFSKVERFPDENIRHGPGYPIFHLEKNADSNALLVSYYNETGNQEDSGLTKIRKYNNGPILISIVRSSENISIDVRDEAGNSILDVAREIYTFDYCKLFAWADGRNTFEISALIEEQER